jgi:integrase
MTFALRDSKQPAPARHCGPLPIDESFKQVRPYLCGPSSRRKTPTVWRLQSAAIVDKLFCCAGASVLFFAFPLYVLLGRYNPFKSLSGLAAGERQRDRVLAEHETDEYLKACPQPWRDCATIILDEGFRPGEVFALRWPYVFFDEDGSGRIQIVEGKSKAARRMRPMTLRVYELLLARYEAAGRPIDGWIFPSASECGHFNADAAKDQHSKALDDSGVQDFVPYVLRHTALTRLGEKAAGNVFALASIAGHSSITVTQRYVHPQADTINRIFTSKLPVGTKLSTTKKLAKG